MDYDITPWLTLKNIKGVGNIAFRRLIDKFQSPENIFRASVNELCSIEGITESKARAIKSAEETEFIKNEIKTAERENIEIIPLTHEKYPLLLKDIIDPPPVLYMRGNHPQDAVSFAVVGSRNPSNESRAKTSVISSGIAKAGIRVVSGMALGIDGAAHSAALKHPGGTTAVLGSGLLNIYPREHKALYNEILKNGAVVSEFSLFTQPEAYNFPARNRIISGISIGILVCEAKKRSGALITANLGADQGKEIFTLNLKHTNSPGTEILNNNGAKKIDSVLEIFAEYPWMNYTEKKDTNKKSLDFNEKLVVKALKQSHEPLHIEELCRECELNYTNEIGAVLTNLELKGIIKQLPGKFYHLAEDIN